MKPLCHAAANERHARLTADEDHLVEQRGLQLCIGQRTNAVLAGFKNEIARQRLQPFARETRLKTEVRREKRQRDVHGVLRRELNLRRLGRLAQTRSECGEIRPARRANLNDTGGFSKSKASTG